LNTGKIVFAKLYVNIFHIKIPEEEMEMEIRGNSLFTIDRGFWIFIIAIIYCIINGVLCSNLAGKEGYKKADV